MYRAEFQLARASSTVHTDYMITKRNCQSGFESFKQKHYKNVPKLPLLLNGLYTQFHGILRAKMAMPGSQGYP